MRAELLFALLTLAGPARAEDPPIAPAEFSHGDKFGEQTGAALYANVCQACHMADGKGATGAGSYPSLATNPNLEQAGYPVSLIIHGRRAMPPFGDMMNDGQIAAVVNYLRTHFGNNYSDVVTAQEVSEARH